MEILNATQLEKVAGANANSGYSPDCAGGSSRGSHSGGGGGHNGRDIYAGTDDCFIGIGLGALSGLFGGPGAALLGVVSNGYNACIGSSSNGSGRSASNSGAGDCAGGIGGVCN